MLNDSLTFRSGLNARLLSFIVKADMSKPIFTALTGALLAKCLLAAPTASSCTATDYSQVSAAVASCTAITLSNIAVPAGSQLDLTQIKPSTTVTFAGTTVSSSSPVTTYHGIMLNYLVTDVRLQSLGEPSDLDWRY